MLGNRSGVANIKDILLISVTDFKSLLTSSIQNLLKIYNALSVTAGASNKTLWNILQYILQHLKVMDKTTFVQI